MYVNVRVRNSEMDCRSGSLLTRDDVIGIRKRSVDLEDCPRLRI